MIRLLAAFVLGLLAIFIAVFAYTEETPFPGVAAMLPVFGAVAVIWAGAPKVRWAPTRAMGTAPRPLAPMIRPCTGI